MSSGARYLRGIFFGAQARCRSRCLLVAGWLLLSAALGGCETTSLTGRKPFPRVPEEQDRVQTSLGRGTAIPTTAPSGSAVAGREGGLKPEFYAAGQPGAAPPTPKMQASEMRQVSASDVQDFPDASNESAWIRGGAPPPQPASTAWSQPRVTQKPTANSRISDGWKPAASSVPR